MVGLVAQLWQNLVVLVQAESAAQSGPLETMELLGEQGLMGLMQVHQKEHEVLAQFARIRILLGVLH